MTNLELVKSLKEATVNFDEFAAFALAELAADRIEALVFAQSALIEARDIMELCWKEQKARTDATEAKLAKAAEEMSWALPILRKALWHPNDEGDLNDFRTTLAEIEKEVK